MRDDERGGGQRQYVIHQPGRGVRQVDEDILGLGQLDQVTAKRGQAPFVPAMGGSPRFVVNKVGQAQQAKASLIQLLPAGQASGQGVRSLQA
jgi:hypothetical protein